jgi:hypothetical protein
MTKILTYLSAGWRMELAPFHRFVSQLVVVAKASSGHFPLPFLISPDCSGLKELDQM